MTNWLCHRDAVKSAIGIPAGSTIPNDLIDDAIQTISDDIAEYLGYPVHAHLATRYYTAEKSDCLEVDVPLLAISALRTDADGDSTHETTWSTGDYWLAPFNATAATPPAPYWEIVTRPNGSGSFPTGILRGVEITGTWGRWDQRRTATAPTLTTGVNATQGTLEIASATAQLHVGQTLRIGDEQLFIRDIGGSTVTVDRGVNGTTAATHSSATGIAYYEYPVVGRLALYQAGRDYRAQAMPEGMGGGEPFGEQRMSGGAGLHPFVRNRLDRLRMPTVA